MAGKLSGADRYAVAVRGRWIAYVWIKICGSQHADDLVACDPAGAQDDGLCARAVNDRRLNAAFTGATIKDQINPAGK